MMTGSVGRRGFVLVLAAVVALAALATAAAQASHTDSSSNPLPHASVKIWDTTSTIGFNPDESDEDVAGLTSHVGAPAIVTVYENTTHPEGPCGIAFWNPSTDSFKWYGITGGFQAGVDVNLSAPTKTGPGGVTLQPGDAWAFGPTGKPIYVNLKGTDGFRAYFTSESPWGGAVDQTTGNVFYAGLSGSIGHVDPATNTETRWSVGGTPRYVAVDSAGRVYATVEGLDEIVRVDPAAPTTVKRWPVPGPGSLSSGGVVTPDGITIDDDGNVWFAESGSSEIGKLDPSTDVITEYTKPGVSGPSLVASSGSGSVLQTFASEGPGTSVDIVTQVEAVGTSTAVTPVVSTVSPTSATLSTEDFTRTPLTATIPPTTVTVDGLNGGPDALGTTKTAAGERIPGILRFPLPTSDFSHISGMTGVFAPKRVAGSDFFTNRLFQLESGAIIAPPPGAEEGRMTGGGSVSSPTVGKVTHGFELNCDATNQPNNLQVNWGKGNRFHLTSLTSASCSNDPGIDPGSPSASFDTYKGEGVGRFNGQPGFKAKWTFTDAGEPGKNDSAEIEITNPAGTVVVLSVAGTLNVGNHQAHPE